MEKLPQFVVKRMQEPAPAVEPHPDADLLTAFAEQSLAGGERELVMAHLARCGDCREVVALAQPASESVASPVTAIPSRVGWLSWPTLRWGAVAAGIVAVISVGVVRYEHGREETTVASFAREDLPMRSAAADQASAPRAVVPPAKAAQIGLPKESAATANAPARDLRFSSPAPSRGETAGRARGGIGGSSSSAYQQKPMAESDSRPPAPVVENSPAVDQKAVIGQQSEVVEVQAATGVINAEPAAPDGREQIAQNQIDLPLQGRAGAKFDVLKAKEPAPAQAGANAGPIPSPSLALQTSPALMKRALPQWMVTPAGALQRSHDGGKTWENVNPAGAGLAGSASAAVSVVAENSLERDQRADKTVAPVSPSPVFRAVSAIGADVWVGGSGGFLYHTVDGGNLWARVIPSAGSRTAMGDITSIQFGDAQHGKIVTSTGEVWATADGGVSWQKQ